MKPLFALLALAVTAAAGMSVAAVDAAGRAPTDHERLDQHLFGSGLYNPRVLPALKGGDNVSVQFGVAAIDFDMDTSGKMSALFWLRITYADPRLAYDSDEFGGIRVFHVDPTRIWTPDVTMYNSLNPRVFLPIRTDSVPRTNALIYPNGNVLFVPLVKEEVLCYPGTEDAADLWSPFNCTLKYGSWTYDGNTLDLQFYNGEKEMDTAEYRGNFRILSNSAEREVKYYECCEEPYPSLSFNITVQRAFTLGPMGVAANPNVRRP